MCRLVVLAVVVLATCACRSQSPPGHDPFFGRTTVPPPPTGSAAVRAIDPYYRGASSPAAGATLRTPSYGDPSVPPPAPRLPASPDGWIAAGSRGTEPASPATPPAGDNMAAGSGPAVAMPAERSDWPGLLAGGPPSTPIRIVEPPPSAWAEPPRAAPPVLPAPTASAQSSPPRTASSLEGRTPVIRVLEPPTAASVSPAMLGAPPPRGGLGAAPTPARAMPRPTASIDIMDLPPAGSRAEAPGSWSDGVRFASAAEPSSGGSGVVAASGIDEAATGAPPSPYAFDPEYRWLRGRLEYSPLDRRWRLRYIPADGQPDAFGGSLVLLDTSLLAGCQRGEFLEVRGRLDRRGTEDAPAPSFVISELQRLGPAWR
jgi:hypothetical protein